VGRAAISRPPLAPGHSVLWEHTQRASVESEHANAERLGRAAATSAAPETGEVAVGAFDAQPSPHDSG